MNKKKLRFLSKSVLAAAAIAPALWMAQDAQAQDFGYYRPNYNSWSTNRRTYPVRNNYGYNYGWNGYNNNWGGYYNGWGWNNGWNNNGYNSLRNDPNYSYSNGNHYYRMSDGSYRIYRNGQWVPLSNSNGYDSLVNDPNYTYWNGNHYYRMSDGSYRIYRNGQWLPLTNNNSDDGYNNLRNDPRYRYENGYHYYVLDNGDYYYYQNGQWIFVKAATEPENPTPTPTPTPDPAPNPTPNPGDKPDPNDNNSDQPSTPSEDEDTSGLVFPENPPFAEEDKPFNPFAPETDTPSTPETPTPDQPAIPGNSGLVDIDEPSESQIPPYVEQPSAEALQHLDWGPNGQVPKIIYPTGKPGDPALQADPNYYYDGSTHYYYVPTNTERTGYIAYWQWYGSSWKLQGMTDPNDPAIDPNLHGSSQTNEYMFDDTNSSHKLWSENVIGTGQAGQPLPFKNLKEFQAYVEKEAKLNLLDNAGYTVKVEYSLEDEFIFNEAVKANYAWARDYVLVAKISSSVKGYESTEFGDIKFIYRVVGDENTTYPNLEKAQTAFAKINQLRKEKGLKELTWSDDIYNNQSLPAATKLGVKYEDTGINFRREEDPEKVATRWVNSGLGELLLSSTDTQGAVACVQSGDGTYYWVFNSN